jgi:hypothetical protein
MQCGIFRIVPTVWYFQNCSDSVVFLELFRQCGIFRIVPIISRGLQTIDDDATGEFVVNDEDEANLLCTFFCSISEIVNSDVPTPVFGK